MYSNNYFTENRVLLSTIYRRTIIYYQRISSYIPWVKTGDAILLFTPSHQILTDFWNPISGTFSRTLAKLIHIADVNFLFETFKISGNYFKCLYLECRKTQLNLATYKSNKWLLRIVLISYVKLWSNWDCGVDRSALRALWVFYQLSLCLAIFFDFRTLLISSFIGAVYYWTSLNQSLHIATRTMAIFSETDAVSRTVIKRPAVTTAVTSPKRSVAW